MQTISSAFERELRALIAERRKGLVEILTNGIAITTMEQYREQVGRLSELDNMSDLLEAANDAVSKR